MSQSAEAPEVAWPPGFPEHPFRKCQISDRFGDTPTGDIAMRIYSYVVARDFGFAPNPFFGYCTLATCKPKIRKSAEIGDRILGTGSKKKQRDGYLVFAMQVDEIMSYNKYWNDSRFLVKRPNMHSSLRNAYGDNIYHKDSSGRWIQEDSHHSKSNGQPCDANIRHDTKIDRVLIGRHFWYWGGSGPPIPSRWQKKVCKIGQGHRKICGRLASDVTAWLDDLDQGYCGEPLDWPSR